MQQVLEKALDFTVRVIELLRYLETENKPFPLGERLLASAMEIGVCTRLSAASGKLPGDMRQKAFRHVVEAEYLLEIVAKMDFLAEKQSIPILNDCRRLKVMIIELPGKPARANKNASPHGTAFDFMASTQANK